MTDDAAPTGPAATAGGAGRRLVLAALLLSIAGGCRGTGWIRMRRVPETPLAEPMALLSRAGPTPMERTMQWLRRHDLTQYLESEGQVLVDHVQRIADEQPSAENVYVLAEVAFLVGKKSESLGQPAVAFDMYGIAVASAYAYLLDDQFHQRRNPYDPRFRGACDLYNASLESAMRLAQAEGPLVPGTSRTIQTDAQQILVSIVSRGSWPAEKIERLEFATDYEVQGLKNHYRTFGLGVPLIAVYRRDPEQAQEQFYAPGMSVPATAFLRVEPEQMRKRDGTCQKLCTLELHDPRLATDIQVAGRWVPLQTDLSTPLAYSLSDSTFQDTDIWVRGFLDPDRSQTVQGLYMLEPFDPTKTPVLMVHGLWSSLITWMEMFNDLRGNRQIRDHYQFWFYLYPTGQPFWITAAQLRQDLRYARHILDPGKQLPDWDRMVLVGHSMGGLIARLQTVDSGDAFWRLVSDQPLGALQASEDVRRQLRQTLFFEPHPSIRRVITIATPFRGSELANGTTQWLARRVVRLPRSFVATTRQLLADNRELLATNQLLTTDTSIDDLGHDSAVLSLLREAPRSPSVHYHNVVGVLPADDVLGRMAGRGDGVVSYASAHLEDVDSETMVPEDHIAIHRHPQTVLEVQRLLLEHLRGADGEAVAADSPRVTPVR
jgi:pimeloyl-ACP methyl ester carboxylesterase